MGTVLRSSDLRGLSLAEKTKAFMRCLNSAPPVDEVKRIKELRKEIRQLERQFSMKSPEMLKRICSGDLADTGKYASWREACMLLRAYEANVRDSA